MVINPHAMDYLNVIQPYSMLYMTEMFSRQDVCNITSHEAHMQLFIAKNKRHNLLFVTPSFNLKMVWNSIFIFLICSLQYSCGILFHQPLKIDFNLAIIWGYFNTKLQRPSAPGIYGDFLSKASRSDQNLTSFQIHMLDWRDNVLYRGKRQWILTCFNRLTLTFRKARDEIPTDCETNKRIGQTKNPKDFSFFQYQRTFLCFQCWYNS